MTRSHKLVDVYNFIIEGTIEKRILEIHKVKALVHDQIIDVIPPVANKEDLLKIIGREFGIDPSKIRPDHENAAQAVKPNSGGIDFGSLRRASTPQSHRFTFETPDLLALRDDLTGLVPIVTNITTISIL